MLSRIPGRFLITAAASVALAAAVPVAALAAGGHNGHGKSRGQHGKGHHGIGDSGKRKHGMSKHGSMGSHRKLDHGSMGGSMGSHGMRKDLTVLNDALAPSTPEDPMLHGVKPGAKPWVLSKGHVRLEADGKLMLHVKGLMIPELGNAGPVKTISAALYCGDSTEAAAMSEEVPLSAKGDARIFDKSFKAPSSCLAPVILVQTKSAAGMSMYIAASGW